MAELAQHQITVEAAEQNSTSPPRPVKQTRKPSEVEDAEEVDIETKQQRQNRGRRQPNRQENSK